MGLVRKLKPLVEAIPGAAQLYRSLRERRLLNSDVLYREALGFRFNGNYLMQEGLFEPLESEIIESILGRCDVFVNIGANSGYYVCKALKQGVSTIAYEPNQDNVKLLLKNIHANDFKAEIHVLPVALGDRPGVLPMYGSATGASLVKGWAGQNNSYLVPVSTLDLTITPFLTNRKCLVLIDIEGAEYGCLRGAESFLSSAQDSVLIIEIGVSEHQPNGVTINPSLYETFELMHSHGFLAYTADQGLRHVALHEVASVMSSCEDTLGTHNFIFVKCPEELYRIRSSTID